MAIEMTYAHVAEVISVAIVFFSEVSGLSKTNKDKGFF